jgi:hypothetical protein
MASNTPSITNFIPERELRPRTSSSISFQTQTRNTNHRLNDRSKPTTTSTPILGRKIVKPNLRRSKSAKTSSRSSKTKKTVALPEDNDRNQPDEPNDEMDQDYTEQTTALNFGIDKIVSNSIINDNPLNENQNKMDGVLNKSNETVDEDHQIKRTTAATRKDVMNYFVKQPDGSFKCVLCTNSNKVRSSSFE